jgi:hypothetical protein
MREAKQEKFNYEGRGEKREEVRNRCGSRAGRLILPARQDSCIADTQSNIRRSFFFSSFFSPFVPCVVNPLSFHRPHNP